MRTVRVFLLIGAAVVLCGVESVGQRVAVPLDSAGRVLRLSGETVDRLDLLPEYRGLSELRLFRNPDSTYSLDIEYTQDGRTARLSIPMSTVDGDAWRLRTAQLLTRKPAALAFDQEGRTRFLVGMAGLSIGLYSWSLPVILDADGSGAVGVGLAMGAGSYFFASAVTANRPLTDGMATLALQGGYRGSVDGLMLASLIDPDMDVQGVVAIATGASVAELYAGYVIARDNAFTRGRAATIATYGNFGLGIGLGAGIVAESDPFDDAGGAAWLLGGSAIGYGLGAYLSAESNYSTGDVDVVTTTGLLGAAVPACVLVATRSEDERVFAGAMSLGSMVGLGLAHVYLRDRDYSASQGYYVYGGTLAGGLIGAGLGFLLAPDDTPEPVIAVATLLGSASGFATMLLSFDDEAKAAARSFSLRVNFTPEVLALTLADSPATRRQPLPFLSIHATF